MDDRELTSDPLSTRLVRSTGRLATGGKPKHIHSSVLIHKENEVKIIGSQGGGVFIATVTRCEIEKLHDKYYSKPSMPETNIGDEYDLSAGYDFRGEIKQACKDMTEAVARFKRAQDAMTRFASMVADMPDGLRRKSRKASRSRYQARHALLFFTFRCIVCCEASPLE